MLKLIFGKSINGDGKSNFRKCKSIVATGEIIKEYGTSTMKTNHTILKI